MRRTLNLKQVSYLALRSQPSAMPQLAQEASSRLKGHAKILGDGLTEIRQRLPSAEIRSSRNAPAPDQNGHVFACVIGRNVTRIATVVRGDHQQVVVTHCALDLDQSCVKTLERPRIALYVIAVPVQHVKVNQI